VEPYSGPFVLRRDGQEFVLGRAAAGEIRVTT